MVRAFLCDVFFCCMLLFVWAFFASCSFCVGSFCCVFLVVSCSCVFPFFLVLFWSTFRRWRHSMFGNCVLLLAENLPLLLASFLNTRTTEKRTETDQNETSRSRIAGQDRPKTAQNRRGRFREMPENRGNRQRYRGGWYRSDTDTEVAGIAPIPIPRWL